MLENKNMKNPYAKSLDGLKLDDPVSAFFNFCKERENIRLLRENGYAFPWTDDPIFQKGRFLNVFREDDRVSKSILSFANELKHDLPKLIQAVFFARWCNKQHTLDELSYKMLLEPEKLLKKLKSLNNWCNYNAYPVESVLWNGKKYQGQIKIIKKDIYFLLYNLYHFGGHFLQELALSFLPIAVTWR